MIYFNKLPGTGSPKDTQTVGQTHSLDPAWQKVRQKPASLTCSNLEAEFKAPTL